MDIERPSQVTENENLAPSDGVREHERRRLATVRPPRVYGEASLRQRVDVAVAMRHFPTLGRALGTNFEQDCFISFMEYTQRLQANMARLERALRVANEAGRARPGTRDVSLGTVRQREGYLRSTVEELTYLRGRVRELTDRFVEMDGMLAHARAGTSVGNAHGSDGDEGQGPATRRDRRNDEDCYGGRHE